MTQPSPDQALFAALQTNDEAGVRNLLDRDPALLRAVSPMGVSPVLFATYYGKHGLARLLVGRMRKAGVPLTVFEAASTGELDSLREHMNARPDLMNATSPDGFTPLGLAAFFGREEVAAELLARGADVNRASANALGARPLHSAVAGDHTALALRLITAGADLAREEGHAAVLGILSGVRPDPEESRNVTLTATRDTGPMTNNGNGRGIDAPDGPPTGEPVSERTGRPDDHTGYQAPDPKDVSQPFYTSTPAEDRVSSAQEGRYEPVEIPDPKEVTGQFDQLATRDPGAMEHQLQAPEFAGAQTVGTGLDTAVLDGAVPMGLGASASLLTVDERQRAAADPNPGYTPPSKEVPPHLGSTPGDLPPGVRPEVQEAVQGDGDPNNS